MIEILSSILASDVLNMGADVRRMQEAGVDSLHVDIMDAHFVPNLSFGPAVVSALKKEFPEIPVYLHAADAVQTQKVDSLMPAVGETVPYDEGDEVCVGSMKFRVLYTPGHTAGSVTLDAGEVLFTGDTMFAGSCGRTDLPSGSPDLMAESLKRLANLEGDRKVLPGHEGFSTLAEERVSNYWVLYAMKL